MQYLSVLIIFVNYKPAFSPHSEDKHKTHIMIIIDKEIIKQERNPKTDDALLIAIGKQLKEIDGWFNRPGSVVKLKWNSRYVTRDKISGAVEQKSMSAIGFNTTVKIAGKTRHVIYAETEENVDNNPVYSPKNESFTGHAVFTENDTERLLWYLMFEPRVKNGVIVREDLETDGKKLAVTRGQSASLLFYLYDDASPLDDARLKIIALNFGIDVDKFATIDLLKNHLYDTVLTQEGRSPGKAIAEFKEYTKNLSDEVKAVALVSRGVFKKIIEFNHEQSAWFWKGDKEEPILRIPINDRGDEMGIRKRLASFLIASKKLFMLQEALGESEEEDLSETSIDVKLDKFTDFEKLSWVELKRALKKGNVAFDKTDKMPKLIELCKEAFGNVEP